MFFRTIFILIALVIVWFILKRWAKQALQDYIDKNLPNPKATVIDAGEMVRCQHCGIHLAKKDAIQVGDVYFCCKEHRTQHGK